MKKIIISLLVCTTIILCSIPSFAQGNISVWDGSVSGSWGSDYDSNSTFSVNSAADFIAFRNMVLVGKDFSGKTVNLNTDIDLNNLNLKYGVGMRTSNDWATGQYRFRGTFEGNGHVIKNIKIDTHQDDAAGFTAADENGVLALFYINNGAIKKLGVENVDIALPTSLPQVDIYAGGMVGLGVSSLATVSECYVKNVSFSGGWDWGEQAERRVYIGGLAAYVSNAATLKNSYTDKVDFTLLDSKTFNNKAYKSGFAGVDNTAIVLDCYSANITYSTEDAKFYDSFACKYNDGPVINTSYTDVPYQINNGAYSGTGNATGDIDDVLSDIESAFSDDANYYDISYLGRYPILTWEETPLAFECGDVKVYRDYDTVNESEITQLPDTNCKYTVVIDSISNNTGYSLDGAILSVSLISDGKVEKTKANVVQLPAISTVTTGLVFSLDETDAILKTGDFLQIVCYRDANVVVPLFASTKIVK